MRFPILIPTMILLTGCIVDKTYDLNKLDPEITVLKTGISYPLGSIPKKGLDDLFDIRSYPIVQCDEDGDYYVSYRPDDFKACLDVAADGSISTRFDPFTYTCYTFPDALTGNVPAFGLDYAQSEVHLQLDSGIPVPARADLSIETYVQGTAEHSQYFFEDIPVVPGSSTVVLQDERLFNPLPNGFIFKDVELSMDPDQQALLQRDTLYVVKGTPVMQVPVAFVAGTEFHYELTQSIQYQLAGIRVRQAVVEMDVVNTIPLEFQGTIRAEDASGDPAQGVTVSVDKPIAGGTVDSPAVTHLTATLLSGDGSIPGTFVLDLKARVTPEMAGVVLNREQGIAVRNIRLSLPEGVQIDLF